MAGWNYRRRVKIAPGVTLNFSRKGVSTSVGPKGARLTYGKHGTYLNTSIPGTGLYRRQKIGGTVKNQSNQAGSTHNTNGIGCLFAVILFSIVFLAKPSLFISIILITGGVCFIFYEIFKANKSDSLPKDECLNIQDEQDLVRLKLISLKDKESETHKILSSYYKCLSILPQIGEAEKILTELGNKKRKKYIEQIPIWEKKKEELTKEFENAKYSANESLSVEHKRIYKDFCESFNELTNCGRLFEQQVIESKDVKITTDDFNFIKNDAKTPVIIREDGSQIYFYPTFIINAKSSTHFDVIPMNEMKIGVYDKTVLHKNDSPKDAEIIGFKYTYENKDGSPDMRRTINPLLTIAKYRVIKITSIDGFKICISNHNIATNFENTLNDLLAINSNTNTIQEKQDSDILDKKIYEKHLDIVKRTYEMASWMKSSDDFQTTLSKQNIKIEGNYANNPINILIEIDFLKCFIKLGKQLDFTNNESVGLTMLFAALNKDLIIEYDKITTYQNATSRLLSEFYKQLKDSIEQNKEPEGGFIISLLLNKVDRKRQIDYLIILHEFCKTVSVADNITTNEELAGIDYVKERISDVKTNKAEQKQRCKTDQKAVDELQKLIGLTSVKSEISSLTNFIKIQKMRQKKGMKVSPISYHCVFTGNPGTGKTTVARIVARIYKELGILKKGHLVETDRSGLVAEYVGQTAVKTNKIIDEALDGVLFIDEAYSLVDGGEKDFGKEAISTLLKRMEDERDRLIVILAGYTNDMKRFIDSNPGLQSRFNRYIEFQDYTADELLQIFEFNLKSNEYQMSNEAKNALMIHLQKCTKEKDERFGNGRFVRNLFERTIEKQANRLSQTQNITADMLTTIEVNDLPE